MRCYQHVAPAEGSLPDMLARARNQDTGQVFEPYQLAAQSNTMLLAGYETTSRWAGARRRVLLPC